MTTAAIPLHGYQARQWRRRLDVGAECAVAFTILPRDAQLQVREYEKVFRSRHTKLVIHHIDGGEVGVRVAFEERAVL